VKRVIHFLLATLLLLTTAFAVDGDNPPELEPKVIVVGKGVHQPGTLSYTEGMTVMQAILKAGGITEFAAARVFLIRNAKSTKVALREILEKGDLKEDIHLQPRDIIYVR
jgi:polysaccharide export outer membrane protein